MFQVFIDFRLFLSAPIAGTDGDQEWRSWEANGAKRYVAHFV